jgi:superfamily II DNA helicase RecQ
MKGYMRGDSCRMNYLRLYLGDRPSKPCGKCDVDLNKRFNVTATKDQLDVIRRYREAHFPVLRKKMRSSRKE